MDEAGWELWRQDDNGNRYLIAHFATRDVADAERRRFEALGHGQTHWVERADGSADPPGRASSARQANENPADQGDPRTGRSADRRVDE